MAESDIQRNRADSSPVRSAEQTTCTTSEQQQLMNKFDGLTDQLRGLTQLMGQFLRTNSVETSGTQSGAQI